MNAGANQSQTADCLTSVEYVKDSGEEMLFTREKLSFQYRYSPFQEMKGAITAATFTLTFLENAKIKQLKIIEHRKKTQPLTEKSAGCIFRNPSHSSAGFLIEKVGLKGKKIGGALISPIHANFIINAGGAKAHDVLSLIQEISEKVKSETGIDLELEVRYIPYI